MTPIYVNALVRYEMIVQRVTYGTIEMNGYNNYIAHVTYALSCFHIDDSSFYFVACHNIRTVRFIEEPQCQWIRMVT